MNLKDITLPAFLWYIMPGINAIFFLVVVPAAVVDFDFLQKGLSWASVLGSLAAALVIGFLMDSMKLYQFTRGYKQAKKRFYLQLASASQGLVETAEDTADNSERGKTIFRLVRLSMGKDGGIFPLWEHSRWVMVNHSAKLAYAACVFWAYLLVKSYPHGVFVMGRYALSPIDGRCLIAIFAVGFLIVGLRLSKESWHVMEDANCMYLYYVLANREELTEKVDLGHVFH